MTQVTAFLYMRKNLLHKVVLAVQSNGEQRIIGRKEVLRRDKDEEEESNERATGERWGWTLLLAKHF